MHQKPSKLQHDWSLSFKTMRLLRSYPHHIPMKSILIQIWFLPFWREQSTTAGVPFDLSIGEFANEGNCAPTVNPLCKRKRGRFGFTAVTTRNDLSFHAVLLFPRCCPLCDVCLWPASKGYCKKNWVFRMETVCCLSKQH